jgi:hypothetical protein
VAESLRCRFNFHRFDYRTAYRGGRVEHSCARCGKTITIQEAHRG